MCTGVGIFKDELRKCLKRVRFGLGVCDVLFYTAKAEEGGIRILRYACLFGSGGQRHKHFVLLYFTLSSKVGSLK